VQETFHASIAHDSSLLSSIASSCAPHCVCMSLAKLITETHRKPCAIAHLGQFSMLGPILMWDWSQ